MEMGSEPAETMVAMTINISDMMLTWMMARNSVVQRGSIVTGQAMNDIAEIMSAYS